MTKKVKHRYCAGCSYSSVKPAEFGLMLCSACSVVTEETEQGTMIYIKTAGEKDRKFVRLLPRAK